MPEGDTVWLTARRMHDALAGAHLVRSDFRVPALATTDVTGETVTEVLARGKHLFVRLDGAGRQQGLSIHLHLRMDGSVHVYQSGTRWRRPGWQARLVLATAAYEAVGFLVHDLRVIPRKAEEQLVGHLGPDLLGPDWDADEAWRRLTAEPDRAIGLALLDQRNLAGLGNLYRTELLFLHGTSPWAPVDAVPNLPRLLRRAHQLLVANRDDWPQVTTGDSRRGRQHWVFERTGRPCHHCETPIRAARQGTAPQDRITYWCPRCQRDPALEPLR